MRRRDSKQWQAREALREATSAIHERLHQAPTFAAIAEQRLSLAGYTDLFRRVAGFHFTVGAGLDLDGDRRELLDRDLETLGAPAPPPLPWTAPAGAADRLGWIYVVEGSSLGGKIIYRQLDYLFGDDPSGRRFFRGSETDGESWRSLCGRLEEEGRTPGARRRMVAGATAAFEMFERLLVADAPHA